MCCGSPTSRCRLRAPGRYGSGWSPRRSTSATGRPYAARRCTPDWAGCARRATLGSDIAGWVDTTGEGVTRFRPGDEVYGDNLALKGGFADYTVAAASALTPPGGATAGRPYFARPRGAGDVPDPRREHSSRRTPPYDLVLDLVAHRS